MVQHIITIRLKCIKSNEATRGRISINLVPVLVLLFVALWFILRGDLFYV